jgi:hypothetical protein
LVKQFRNEFQAQSQCWKYGGQFSFRDKASASLGFISEFRISGTNNGYSVWDITDPLNAVAQELTFNNDIASFTIPTDNLHQFIAFDNQTFLTPHFHGAVENQNLHAFAQANMIIVTNPLLFNRHLILLSFTGNMTIFL